MKQITTYNRCAGLLNKLFDMLNKRFFDGELVRPVLTLQSTPKAYGHFTTRGDTWVGKLGTFHEINLGAGSLNESTEFLCGVLLHEMCHYYAHIHGIKDCSRSNGSYHNQRFKALAEAHGLIAHHDPKYGWTRTELNDEALLWLLEEQLPEIEICRNDFFCSASSSGGAFTPSGGPAVTRRSSRRYVCPSCSTIIRATRDVNVGCLDCGIRMVLSEH